MEPPPPTSGEPAWTTTRPAAPLWSKAPASLALLGASAQLPAPPCSIRSERTYRYASHVLQLVQFVAATGRFSCARHYSSPVGYPAPAQRILAPLHCYSSAHRLNAHKPRPKTPLESERQAHRLLPCPRHAVPPAPRGTTPRRSPSQLSRAPRFGSRGTCQGGSAPTTMRTTTSNDDRSRTAPSPCCAGSRLGLPGAICSAKLGGIAGQGEPACDEEAVPLAESGAL